jgi:transcriptional regulator with XRE-family HTH domain
MAHLPTLGSVISDARKQKGLSQKDLAARIKREEGDAAISPQYLNDIEHDRRTPSSDHMIKQFATELGMSENFLFFVANRIPAELRKFTPDAEAVDRFVSSAATAFRRQRSGR